MNFLSINFSWIWTSHGHELPRDKNFLRIWTSLGHELSNGYELPKDMNFIWMSFLWTTSHEQNLPRITTSYGYQLSMDINFPWTWASQLMIIIQELMKTMQQNPVILCTSTSQITGDKLGTWEILIGNLLCQNSPNDTFTAYFPWRSLSHRAIILKHNSPRLTLPGQSYI